MTNHWKFTFGFLYDLIYIHVLRYLASQSNGLFGQLFFSLLSVSSQLWFATLLPFKLSPKSPRTPQWMLLFVQILTCQDMAVRCPLPFLALDVFHRWLLLVVDCKRRLSVVSILASSLPFCVIRLLLLNEFMERKFEFVVVWFVHFVIWIRIPEAVCRRKKQNN